MKLSVSLLLASTVIGSIAISHADSLDNAAFPKGQAGHRIYIDPMTGQLIPGPELERSEPIPLSARERNAMSTSSRGLVEEYHPDGSVSVNLQGRFQSAIFATVDKEGKVRISHTPSQED